MTADRVSALFFLALSIAYGVLAQDIRLLPFAAGDVFTPRTMPTGLAIVGAIIATLMLILPGRRDPDKPHAMTDLIGTWRGFAWGRIGSLLVAMSIYAALLTRLGFIISTILFLIAGYWILGERRWSILLLASVPVVVVFWVLLTQLLGIYLEPGIFRDLI